jgi:RNA polymerase sigma-70 factor (ECF subfamily)
MDSALLQRIAARDGSALGELYDLKAGLLYSLIVRILQDPGDAEDVLQEVFLRVWQQADTYDPVFGEPTSWLVRIARNRAIDRVRARGARPIAAEGGLLDMIAASDGSHPHFAMAGAETREAVKDALLDIDPDQRVLILHAFFLGYTQSELADKFSLPLGTVKTRIRRGMMAMRKKLHHHQP